MRRVSKVKALPGYRLELEFDNGVSGTVDLSENVGKGVVALWRDPLVFEQVRIGSSGESSAKSCRLSQSLRELYFLSRIHAKSALQSEGRQMAVLNYRSALRMMRIEASRADRPGVRGAVARFKSRGKGGLPILISRSEVY
jgi:hypothetical protein